MGRTKFEGPVYGAKMALASFYAPTIAAEANDVEFGELLVPSGEDWYLTDVSAYCTNQGNGATIDVESPDGTSLLAADISLATAAAVNGAFVADAGEDEGKRVGAGARIHLEADCGITTAAAGVMVVLRGYVRKLNTPL